MNKNWKEKLEQREGIYFSKINREVFFPETSTELNYEVEDESFWFNHRRECIANIFEKEVEKGSLVIDLGGGNGFICQKLQEKYETVLLEPNFAGVSNAKKRGIKNIVWSTLEDSTLQKNNFDAVGLFDVLEHIEEPKQFLKEARKLLKEKGKFIITVPAFKFLWSYDDDKVKHFKRYNKKELTQLLKEAGYEIKYISYFFSFLVLPIFFMRTLPYLLKIKIKNPDKKEKQEHQIKNKFTKKIVNYISRKEKEKISKNKRIFWGSSIIAVAEIN